MTITINYKQSPSPRKAVTLHNVEAVYSKGVGAVEIRMMFTDDRPLHEHVASVSVTPERE